MIQLCSRCCSEIHKELPGYILKHATISKDNCGDNEVWIIEDVFLCEKCSQELQEWYESGRPKDHPIGKYFLKSEKRGD